MFTDKALLLLPNTEIQNLTDYTRITLAVQNVISALYKKGVTTDIPSISENIEDLIETPGVRLINSFCKEDKAFFAMNGYPTSKAVDPDGILQIQKDALKLVKFIRRTVPEEWYMDASKRTKKVLTGLWKIYKIIIVVDIGVPLIISIPEKRREQSEAMFISISKSGSIKISIGDNIIDRSLILGEH